MTATCKNCGEEIRAINYALGPGWEHVKTRSSRCEHLHASPEGAANYLEACEMAVAELGPRYAVKR